MNRFGAGAGISLSGLWCLSKENLHLQMEKPKQKERLSLVNTILKLYTKPLKVSYSA